MDSNLEPVKLDQIIKMLFEMSNSVLVNLLNGVFEEDFKEDEVVVTKTSNEIIDQNLDVIRGDMFFKVEDIENKVAKYHIEFQTLNDNSMVIRMFEYGFKNSRNDYEVVDGIKTIYMPKQKVIYFEENKNIEDELKLNIVFGNGEQMLYKVSTIKYWELSSQYLYNNKMYPLMPIQLFNLRKELKKAKDKNDVERIKDISKIAKNMATEIATTSSELFYDNKILGEDMHKMLLAIQNLIEYLNKNYINDRILEEEVNVMTKTLYDPVVAETARKDGMQAGMQVGIRLGVEENKIKNARNLLNLLDDDSIAKSIELDIETVKSLRKEYMN